METACFNKINFIQMKNGCTGQVLSIADMFLHF